ncbi:MAG: DUF4389 domain-containing protein [Bacteroidota bacterium]|nr:DUF4389 domain-containing protein [Bacteroidota bacterium]MXW13533.1 DUF4389 domain-containing protein [Rhodothermaceae bacterium]MCY3628466.1 DUF4389 domain-containing protein [Bacteroidota bacterium]MDE2646561.1 DUF4389 domain-containing protein [Bacteroidota bacterium]MYC04831.1 DUF4389 domain-containing protein [Rhodothermaceae bacterium]
MRYPTHLEIPYQDRQSRLSVLLRLPLVLPAMLIVNFFTPFMSLSRFLVGLSIVVSAHYPRWLFELNMSSCRFEFRSLVYLLLLTDDYPTFQKNAGVLVEIDYPDEDDVSLARLLPLLKWLFVFPHVIILSLLSSLLCLITPVCWLSVLLMGRYPDGVFSFAGGVLRWWLRVYAYGWMLATDQYPPFSLEE